VSRYDDYRYPLVVPTYRYHSPVPPGWTLRADIKHSYSDEHLSVVEERVPAPPRLKHEAITRPWDDGEVTLVQVMRVACPKCLTPQEFAVAHQYAPAIMTTRWTAGDRELGLAAAVESYQREVRQQTARANRAERELEERRWRPRCGWAEYHQELASNDE